MLNVNFEDQFDKTISNLLSPDKLIRNSAENYLNDFINNNYETFISISCKLLSDEKYTENNRQMICYLFKNKILAKETINKWISLLINTNDNNDNFVFNFKENLMATLLSKSLIVRRADSNLISTLIKIEMRINLTKWTYNVLEILLNVLNNVNEDYVITTALDTLGYIFEDLSSSENENINNLIPENILNNSINIILSIIFNNLNNEFILKSSLKSLINILPMCNNIFKNENEKHLENIFITIFKIAENLNNNSDPKLTIIIELICKFLIQLCDKHYFNIYNQINQIIKFTNLILNSNNKIITERIILFTLEIWCVIGDNELELSNIYSENLVKKSLKYLEQFSEEIFKFSTENLTKIKTNFDEWSISKASAYILSILIKITNSSFLEKLLVYSENNYNSGNELMRYSSLLALSCCLETIHKDKIANLLKFNFNNFIKTLQDKSDLVALTSSWLLCKISEIIPYIIDRNKYIIIFCKIIKNGNDEGLFNNFNNDDNYLEDDYEGENNIKIYSKQIRINLCHILINLIKFYGDKNTIKNNNLMSTYYMQILDYSVKSSFDIQNFFDTNFNLSFHSFQIMNCIIDYSSEDFQDFLEVVLNTFIDLFEKINCDLSSEVLNGNFNLLHNLHLLKIISTFSENIDQNNFNNILSINKLIDFFKSLQENISTLIEKIFRKIKRQINLKLCIKLYNLVINSFKIRGDVHEEGLSLISYIAINLKENFIPLLNDYQEYLIYSVKKIEDSTLCKTAIISCSNLVTSFNNNFNENSVIIFIENLIPILFQILIDDKVNRSIKIVTISLIGDIFMNIPKLIFNKNYFEDVMTLLFSACEIIYHNISDNDHSYDEDEDLYILELQKVLIECFTSINFGINEIQNENKNILLNNYAKYVLKIFKFLEFVLSRKLPKIFKNEEIKHNEIIINSMALIADISTMYPNKEIQPLINKKFILENLNRLKEMKNEKNKMTIDWIDKTIKEKLN